jgi:hypothetical protein
MKPPPKEKVNRTVINNKDTHTRNTQMTPLTE